MVHTVKYRAAFKKNETAVYKLRRKDCQIYISWKKARSKTMYKVEKYISTLYAVSSFHLQKDI